MYGSFKIWGTSCLTPGELAPSSRLQSSVQTVRNLGQLLESRVCSLLLSLGRV